MSFFALVTKDLRRELRGKTGIQAGLVLAGLLLLVALFAYPDAELDSPVAAAVLWGPLLYAGIAAAGRGMASESDAGTLDRLRMAGIDAVAIGASRSLVDLLVAALVVAASAITASLLFAVPLQSPLLAALALATVGVALVGSLAAGIAAQTRGRDILLPLLCIPLLAPLVQAGVSATTAALEGATWSDLSARLLAMAGFDVAALAGAWILWPFLLESDA